MRTLFIAAALLLGVSAASAQAFPSKPVRIVVPSAPGGSVDMLSRLVGKELQERIGQPVIIENKPGAGGAIGAEYVAAAPADGYTLLMGTIGALASDISIQKVRYDPIKDFIPVTLVGQQDMALCVAVDSSAKNIGDLLRIARSRPQPITFGVAGRGAGGALSSYMFSQSAGIPMLDVQYKGSAPAMTDLIAGRLDFMFLSTATAAPSLQSNKLRVLATTGNKRTRLLPDVPTLQEAGFKDYLLTNWYGLVAPARTPPTVIQSLNSALRQVLTDPKVQEKIDDEGLMLTPTSSEEFGKLIASEIVKWRKVLQAAGVAKID